MSGLGVTPNDLRFYGAVLLVLVLISYRYTSLARRPVESPVSPARRRTDTPISPPRVAMAMRQVSGRQRSGDPRKDPPSIDLNWVLEEMETLLGDQQAASKALDALRKRPDLCLSIALVPTEGQPADSPGG